MTNSQTSNQTMISWDTPSYSFNPNNLSNNNGNTANSRQTTLLNLQAPKLFTRNDKLRKNHMKNATINNINIGKVTININKSYYVPIPQKNTMKIVTNRPINQRYIHLSKTNVQNLKKISKSKSNSA